MEFAAEESVLFRAAGALGGFFHAAEALAAFAGPAGLFRGDADHEGVVGNVGGDDGAGGDEAVTPQGDAADDCGVGADARAAADDGLHVVVGPTLGVFAARIADVGEGHRRAAEDVVLQFDAFVDRDVILNLAVIADADVGGDVDVLTDGTVRTDPRAGLDVGEVPDLRAVADLHVFINDAGGMDVVASLLRPAGADFDAGEQAAGGVFENLEDFHAAFAIGDLRRAAIETIDEILKLGGEGHAPLKVDDLGRAFARDRLAANPVDALFVEEQPAAVGAVFEGEHALGADDDEAVLLKGMQPTDEDVAGDVVGVAQTREGGVVDAGLQEGGAARDDLDRSRADEMLEDGNVVRGEAPEDVLLGSDGAEVEAVAVDVLQFADFAFADERADAADRGMEEKHVADHEIDAVLRGGFDEAARLGGA